MNIWDAETIRRFWDWQSRRPDADAHYFSSLLGDGIVNLMAMAAKLDGCALDYGCGAGHIAGRLLKRGCSTHGLDTSEASVAALNTRFLGRPGWEGATVASGFPSPYADGQFDWVVCIETLEHVLDATLPDLLDDIHRLLKPGGLAIFTTPCNEDLTLRRSFCPFCDTEFHAWQHLRSFSPETLERLLSSHGFRVLFAKGVDLNAFQRSGLLPGDSLWLKARIRAARFRAVLLDRVFPRCFPNGRLFRLLAARPGGHLCAVATV